MSIKDKISDDMKAAMRGKDSARLDAIRMLRAAIQRIEVDKKITLDDAGVIGVAEKLVKQAKDSIAQFQQGGREDLVAKEQADLAVWQDYLPAQLDEAAVDAVIDEALSASGASSMRDMGKVMGLVKPKLQGQADMATVSAKIKQRLGG